MKETIVILGMQWGDCGKGKIAHATAKKTLCDLMVRFNGGSNAGHTVTNIDGVPRKFNQLPSGHSIPGMRSVIANGSVIDPIKLMAERGGATNQLTISDAAHIITGAHIGRESILEKHLKIGSIGTGNGPAYSDKMLRTGMRVGQLMRGDNAISIADSHLKEALVNSNIEVTDTTKYLRDAQKYGDGVMILEGAHGWELDIDHGDYPYVTSSSCGIGGAVIGTGLDPKSFDRVIGVVKAYSTRVGAGAFAGGMLSSERMQIRDNHSEIGTVSGRQRRVDWIDISRVKAACEANGVDEIALTHVDVLKGMNDVTLLGDVENVYLPGWNDDISEIKRFDDLPDAVVTYISMVEELTDVKVSMISVGPREDQLIYTHAR